MVGPGSGVTPHRDRWEREGKGGGKGERDIGGVEEGCILTGLWTI